MKQKKNNHKHLFREDIIVLLLLYIIAVSYAYITRDMYIGKNLFSGMVLILPPVIYLGLRRKKNWKKLLIASFTFGMVYGLALSYYAEATGSWSTINQIFNFRVFGLSALEEIIGQGLMSLMVFTFYEHFFDDERQQALNKRYWKAILLGIAGAAILIFVKCFAPDKFAIFPYPYVAIGTIAILPLFYAVIKRPKFLPKLALTGLYFFFFWLIIEIPAVAFNYWIYPGNYIGWIELFGVRFPFEELFYWMLFYAPALVVYYEFSMDDAK